MASTAQRGWRRRKERRDALTATGSRIQWVKNGRALTAAATRLPLDDRKEAARQMRLRQGWQLNAWAYRDSIGELRYALNFLANCAARMKVFPAAYPAAGESDNPVALDELEETVPAQVITACAAAMQALGNGRLAVSQVMHTLSTNTSVAGESFLLGQQDEQTGEEVWSIRSVGEIQIKDERYYLREVPADSQGILGAEELKPELTVISRIWTPHPQWRLWADSPMRAIQDDCEGLLINRRLIRAAARSRLAGAGILGIPEELEIKSPMGDNADPEADDFLGTLAEAMMTPLDNEGAASAVVPILVRGPGEHLKNIVHIKMGDQFSAEDAAVRAELVGVIATALDLPKEIIMGVADLNHWSAWQVDDNTFRHHVEPHVILCCDSLTGAFLRPFLEDEGVPEEWVRRLLFWYDPTELVTHPDRTADAKDAYADMVISAKARRDAAGFDDNDAPTVQELEMRRVMDIRALPLNLLMEYASRADPTLVVPPMTGPPQLPGIKPGGGVDVGAPPPTAVAPAAALPSIEAPAEPPPAEKPLVPGPPPVTGSAGQIPPNYRPSDTPGESCDTCEFIDVDTGVCSKFNVTVDRDHVCDAWKVAPVTAAGGEPNTGAMVALYPPPDLAAQWAVVGGEAPDELHLTLAFLGDADQLSDPDALKAAVEAWAKQTAPITGEISGVGMFTAGEDPVTYLSPDLPSLPDARQQLVDALASAGAQPSQEHGFTPHITLDYADRVGDVDTSVGGTEVTFGAVSVVIAEDRTDYRFSEALTASGRRTANHRLSRKLAEIDRDLRTRLQTAANAAMLRQLERVGNRLRSKVAKDERLRTKIAQRANERVSAVLGPAIVTASGVNVDDMLGQEWSGLRSQFDQWTGAAQRQALATALKIGGVAKGSDAAVQAQAALDSSRDAAWEMLSGALAGLSQHLLYNPDPNHPDGEWGSLNPNTLVPTGTIRAALGIAGGASASAVTVGSDGAVSTTGFVGQIGTGSTVSGLLSDAGGEQAQWEWNHAGSVINPLESHEALDGMEFASFDDDALANPDSFPDNAYLFPGDHDGCTCDAMPLWSFPGSPINDSEGE